MARGTLSNLAGDQPYVKTVVKQGLFSRSPKKNPGHFAWLKPKKTTDATPPPTNPQRLRPPFPSDC